MIPLLCEMIFRVFLGQLTIPAFVIWPGWPTTRYGWFLLSWHLNIVKDRFRAVCLNMLLYQGFYLFWAFPWWLSALHPAFELLVLLSQLIDQPFIEHDHLTCLSLLFLKRLELLMPLIRWLFCIERPLFQRTRADLYLSYFALDLIKCGLCLLCSFSRLL